MIPKTIHYCWFGGNEKPKLAKKCIASWEKYCPNWEIVEWNESNFDVNQCEYTKFCYENKKYAYLSDYVRLWAVSQRGGIYFDTDVELIRSPEQLLEYGAFFGFEGKQYINTGLGFGAVKNHWTVVTMLKAYQSKTAAELEQNLSMYNCLTGSPKMNTYAITPLGLVQNGKMQLLQDAAILPEEYLCPFDDQTGELNTTPNSISIHWYGKSANGKMAAFRSRALRPVKRILKRLWRGKV